MSGCKFTEQQRPRLRNARQTQCSKQLMRDAGSCNPYPLPFAGDCYKMMHEIYQSNSTAHRSRVTLPRGDRKTLFIYARSTSGAFQNADLHDPLVRSILRFFCFESPSTSSTSSSADRLPPDPSFDPPFFPSVLLLNSLADTSSIPEEATELGGRLTGTFPVGRP